MQFTRTMWIAAPREQVWELLADTDRLNREVGLLPVSYQFVPRAVGGAEMFGTVQIGRLRLRYREDPWEWVRPEFHSVRRVFERGPITEYHGRTALLEEEGRTRLLCETRLTPRHLAAAPLVMAVGQKLHGDLVRTWQSFGAFLTGQATTPYPRHSGQVPAHRSRLERGLAVLQATEADPTVVRQLATYLVEAPPEDVTLLRPFALADRWGLERLAVLRTFLLATRAELLELRWRLLCPACRGSVPENTGRTLRDIGAQAHCPTCNIRYDAEFDRSVEVSFCVAPAIRPVQERTYCRGGPGLTPHIHAQFVLEPGQTRTISLALTPGRFALVSPQAPASINLRVVEAEAELAGAAADGAEDPQASVSQEARLTDPFAPSLSPTVAPAVCASLEMRSGQSALTVSETRPQRQASWTLTNHTAEMAVLRLESQEVGIPVATADLVTSLQVFRDQFGSEVLSPGTEVAVRQMCFLFSDLKGSTAMYRERGDAPSYRAVRDYFQALRRIAADHDGAVVKTIGDAVMATFPDPANGLSAALAILKAAPTWPDQLTVKMGLHIGPAIAVNANDLLDYFGQTVNLAARLQHESLGEDITVVAELLQDTSVAQIMTVNACGLEPFTHSIRGFDAPLSMVRITLGDASDPASLRK